MIANMDGYSATKDDSNLMCGCHKTAASFSTEYLEKVITDTGDHYRLPGDKCDWIDPDGHCHHNDEVENVRNTVGNKVENKDIVTDVYNVHKTIPKQLISGV